MRRRINAISTVINARIAFAVLSAASLGCGAANYEPRPMRLDPPARTLILGKRVHGDTTTPDGRTSSSCKHGGRAGQALDHLYGFQVAETATYRFELIPEFSGVIQIQQRHPKEGWYFGIGCAAADAGNKAVVSVSLDPGLYWVVVDGNLWDQDGPYTLRVEVDRSARAQIGPEDVARVSAFVANAPTMRVGERAFGTFRSVAGGARTRCGTLGGNGVNKLSLDRPARVRVRAAAHFPLAVEVRAGGSATSFGCKRAAQGGYDVELVVDLPEGEFLVVLDALKLAPRHPHFDSSGIVRGAYVIDTEQVER